MMRVSGIVGIGLLVLSLPQHAVGTSTKQKQRDACSGMSSGDVSQRHLASMLVAGST